MSMPKCDTCNSNKNVVRWGYRENKKGKVQTYRCKRCSTLKGKHRFTPNKLKRRYSEDEKKMFMELLKKNKHLSILSVIEKSGLNVSKSTVREWRKKCE